MPFRFTDIAQSMPRSSEPYQSDLGGLFMQFAAQKLQQQRAQEQAQIQRQQLAQQQQQHGDEMALSRQRQDQAKSQWDAMFKRQGEESSANRAEGERRSRVEHAGMVNQALENDQAGLAKMLTSSQMLPPGMWPMEMAMKAGVMPQAPAPQLQMPQPAPMQFGTPNPFQLRPGGQ